MELKALAGDRDLYDVLKKQQKKKKKAEKKAEAKYLSEKSETSVFDFINKKLGGKKGVYRGVEGCNHDNIKQSPWLPKAVTVIT